MKNLRLAPVLLALLAAACQSTGPAPTSPAPTSLAPAATASEPAPPATSPSGAAEATDSPAGGAEVVKLAGDTYMDSEVFSLDVETALQVKWEYTGAGFFALWILNAGEEVTDPAYDRILVTQSDGATSGSADYALVPGDYLMQIEQADGPWTVEVIRAGG